ncbi:MAG: hypothetical protein ACNFW9_06070 [Candidatus Kerfeldbacteria bacterium]
MSADIAMNIVAGINYCAPTESLGFRGVSNNDNARMIPLPDGEKKAEQIFLMFGVDIPSKNLPYIPDMEEGSDFRKQGHWHHYQIKASAFIIHIDAESLRREILHVVLFEGEETPRILLDRREIHTKDNTLSENDFQKIEQILQDNKIVLPE